MEGRAEAAVDLQPRRGAAELCLAMSELGAEYDKLKKWKTMLKCGGCFYCGKGLGRLRHRRLPRVHARAVHQV